MTDRLAQLEAQAAALSAEIAALKAGRPLKTAGKPEDLGPSVKAFEDKRGVTISQVITETTIGPSLQEARKLFTIVKPLAPWKLDDRYDEDRPFRAFCAALRWAQNVGRADEPNSKVALSFWLDHARNWLRARNAVGGEIDANVLIMAVMASGDIPYQRADPSQGRLWEIGLRAYGGRPASADAWRAVMTTGNILGPSRPARRYA
jgi:hypothetical protein